MFTMLFCAFFLQVGNMLSFKEEGRRSDLISLYIKILSLIHFNLGYETVVLGWIIPLCVGLGIEPATFRFQSKALITPLPSLRSSSTFLLSLSSLFSTLSVLLPSFLFHPLLLLAEKKMPKRKTSRLLFTPPYP